MAARHCRPLFADLYSHLPPFSRLAITGPVVCGLARQLAVSARPAASPATFLARKLSGPVCFPPGIKGRGGGMMSQFSRELSVSSWRVRQFVEWRPVVVRMHVLVIVAVGS